ncbi:MAG: T9SS type A sorting domain-containing protein [Bacteroidota bacterium]
MKNFLIALFFVLAIGSVQAQYVMDETVDVDVCFTLDHTFVSDLGFYLLAPGGDTIAPGNHGVVQLLPPVSNWGPDADYSGWTGTPFDVLGCAEADDENSACQSGNDVVNLCFTSTMPAGYPDFTLCVCDAETPLTGEYASVEAWDSVYGYPLTEPWGVAVSDCEQYDYGQLKAVSIEFTYPDGRSIMYDMPGQSDTTLYPINDESCSLDSATRMYMVPDSAVSMALNLVTPAPEPAIICSADSSFDENPVAFMPFHVIDSIELLSAEMISSTDCQATYLIHQSVERNNQSFSLVYNLPDPTPDVLDLQMSLYWNNPVSGAVMTLDANHVVESNELAGAENLISRSQPKVYPNPAGDYLTIDIDHSAAYEIFSSDGKLLKRGTTEAGITTLKLDDLSAGHYVLKITSDNVTWKEKLVVK